ncbi:hypothetical protein DPSP01_001262 [Paraphaeosphaeria sporulosa]
MVVPAFGFSVGDFIAGTNLLLDVLSAFRSADGASSGYASDVSFLSSLTATLSRIEEHTQKYSQDETTRDITKLVVLSQRPLMHFKAFLDKYENSLGAAGFGKGPKRSAKKGVGVVRYTLAQISDEVGKLKEGVERPLGQIHVLLSLQIFKRLDESKDQILRPSQCAQIVDAIAAADIPAALGQELQKLQQKSDETNTKHDQLVVQVEELRLELCTEMRSVRQMLEQLPRQSYKDISTTAATSIPEVRQTSTTLNTARESITEQETLTSDTIRYLQQMALLNSESHNDEQQERDLYMKKSNLTLQTAHTILSLLAIIRSNVLTAASSSQPIQSPTQTSSQYNFALFTTKPPLPLVRPSDIEDACGDGSTANQIGPPLHVGHDRVIPRVDHESLWSGIKHEKPGFCIKCGMFHAGVQENEALAVETIYHYAYAKRRGSFVCLLILVFVAVQLYFILAHMKPEFNR